MCPAFHPEASIIGHAGVPLAIVYLNVAGTGVRMTVRFTLLRTPEGWTVRRWESEGTCR